MSLPDGRHGPASCAAASAGTTVPAATTAEAVATPEHIVVSLPAVVMLPTALADRPLPTPAATAAPTGH
ncbi:hypothetical protein ACWD4L_07860 [Streptomyces sp. NPDC002596]